MPVDTHKIAQLELALAEAKAELMRENGLRYEIIMREITEDEKQRILDSLTDRRERILFGLEVAPGSERPAKSGGDLSCPICGKTGLTELGLKLHRSRKHKGEAEPSEPALFQSGRKSGQRAGAGTTS